MKNNLIEGMCQNKIKVCLEDVSEIIYWTDKFHCSATELLIAIEAVGTSPVDIDDYLGSL